jgi:RNA polymerase sigma-70 factor, ECF subfamily
VFCGVDAGTDGFAGFYEASYSHVVALLAAMLGDWHQAEDIAQEAFARALARWPRVAGYDAPEAWVRQVALRLVVDAGRRSRRAIRASALLAAAQSG